MSVRNESKPQKGIVQFALKCFLEQIQLLSCAIRKRWLCLLRIYAIKLDPGIYVITGGAIKLTRTMQEREHTLVELAKMERVRRYMLENNIVDMDSFQDYLNEIS